MFHYDEFGPQYDPEGLAIREGNIKVRKIAGWTAVRNCNCGSISRVTMEVAGRPDGRRPLQL